MDTVEKMVHEMCMSPEKYYDHSKTYFSGSEYNHLPEEHMGFKIRDVLIGSETFDDFCKQLLDLIQQKYPMDYLSILIMNLKDYQLKMARNYFQLSECHSVMGRHDISQKKDKFNRIDLEIHVLTYAWYSLRMILGRPYYNLWNEGGIFIENGYWQ